MSNPFNRARFNFDCPPNCPERKPACQDHCERYLKKRAELDALNAAERKRHDAESYTIDLITEKRDRAARKRKALPPHRQRP